MSKQPIEVIVEARATLSETHVVRFGKFMGLRQYGNTPHVELFSDAPGNDGLERIVILESDYRSAADLLVKLADISEEMAADGDIQDRKPDDKATRKGSRRTKKQSNRKSA